MRGQKHAESIMKIESVCIIGLGLIGSSIARAIKAKTDITSVCAIDLCADTIKKAKDEGIITFGGTDKGAIAKSVQLVFVCTPADTVCDWVKDIVPIVEKDCIICDTASTKGNIIEQIEGLQEDFRFVGGHPMAGAESSGYSAGRAHLFENAYFVLTPCKKSDSEAIELLSEFTSLLGALPLVTDPKTHDRATALVSHLPHVAASALVNILGDNEDDRHINSRFAAGGFRDITRIASSPADLWAGILLENAEEITALIDAYIKKLSCLKDKVSKGDRDELFQFFERGKTIRDGLSKRLNSLIPKTYELYVDVEDKPGMISTVASIISSANINIKNINISNNRSEPGGIMLVSLENEEGVLIAAKALSKQGICCKAKDN